jgi:hypothetical protein
MSAFFEGDESDGRPQIEMSRKFTGATMNLMAEQARVRAPKDRCLRFRGGNLEELRDRNKTLLDEIAAVAEEYCTSSYSGPQVRILDRMVTQRKGRA